MSHDGTTLLVTNSDSNSVSLIDTTTQSVLAEIVVGLDPRTVAVNDSQTRAYIANRGSDTISVLDLSTNQLMVEGQVGNRPYGLVVSPDGERLYVAEQGSGYLNILDAKTLKPISRLYLGDKPSGLALSEDGLTLYVTHLLKGTITILDVSRPFTTYLPITLSEHSLSPSIAADPQPPIPSPQTIPLWPDSNLVQSFVIGPDNRTAYVPHTRSNAGNTVLTFDSTVIPIVSLVDLTTQEHLIGQQFNLGSLDPPGVGLPFDTAGEAWTVWSISPTAGSSPALICPLA